MGTEESALSPSPPAEVSDPTQHRDSSTKISPHYKMGRVSVHTVDSPFFFYSSFRSSVAQQEGYRNSRVGAESNHTVSLPSSIYTRTTLGSPTETLKYHMKYSDPLLSHSCWSSFLQL